MLFLQEWILTLLIVLPLVGAVAVAIAGAGGRPLVPRSGENHDEPRGPRLGQMALAFSLATGVLTILAVALFFTATSETGQNLARAGGFALVQDLTWVADSETARRQIDFRYHLGVDGLSIWLVALTAFITPLSIWASFSGIRHRQREYYALMLLLEASVIGVFCARDLLLFYIFFEFTLIPLFFIIGIWGGPQKWAAAGKFFLYTFAGSMLTFAGVLYLAWQAARQGGVFTFDIDTLYRLQLTEREQFWLFLAFTAGFAIKVPLFPFHTWLPLAHTEAPTAGSVLLAGLLLKLGTYGFLRFNLPMLPAATQELAPLVAVLAIIGIIYGALVAWVQDDFKRLVAYSSVSHLGFCMLGMFALNQAGLTGSVLYMINHGLSTGALFLVIGMIYERYHTRQFDKLGGLARRMPWMAFFLVFFVLSSIALPGLNGFISEFLVLLGTFTSRNPLDGWPAGPLGAPYGVIAAVGIILSAVYMLAMVQRLLFGQLKEPEHTPDTSGGLRPDLTRREITILTPIALACLILGVYPKPVIDSIQPAAQQQVLAWVYAGDTDAAFAGAIAPRDAGAPARSAGPGAKEGGEDKDRLSRSTVGFSQSGFATCFSRWGEDQSPGFFPFSDFSRIPDSAVPEVTHR
ncbi:MAG TPA: NADH-quinone oxidoreductase subunit M [Phycisphaerae bacterium]|jgi:NADH-quinone oxidoreductase subunit M|nr:NADH-quinone oxidoreductase subunit M [Phycisphaerae bacterium]HOB73327.1 NADH-quinone oxidoreductase subunit M [Phycisphaerae bacterium]HOJ55421.1 NADH-quinone oxidoreductase subunit M [Phycisphaerae bacterium]HOL24969.1 NADH-quinone oxidoreductase subunit M [Phycisphaerae bacterium]HPP20071.1 NADH-quinone oxidoreductase subunit M [Phycisphaerae bacterium]